MKFKSLNNIGFALLLLLMLATPVSAQTVYTLEPGKVVQISLGDLPTTASLVVAGDTYSLDLTHDEGEVFVAHGENEYEVVGGIVDIELGGQTVLAMLFGGNLEFTLDEALLSINQIDFSADSNSGSGAGVGAEDAASEDANLEPSENASAGFSIVSFLLIVAGVAVIVLVVVFVVNKKRSVAARDINQGGQDF